MSPKRPLLHLCRAALPAPVALLARVALLAPVALVALWAPPAAAQDDPLEGHSHQGEAFNEGPRQAAYLMPNPGSVHFPVTTSDERAQAFFDQGMGQLHGFWYFESERSFRQVAAIDRDCAMAYWGMAMANVDNPERAADLMRVAWLRRGMASERERMYIDALARFYGVEGPEEPKRKKDKEGGGEKDERQAEDRKASSARLKARTQRLIVDYEEIIWEYPDDIEAKALLVIRLWLAGRSGISTPSRQANEALLAQVFAAQPMHPAHHYRIHLWDSRDAAQRVVESAVKSGPSWPSVAHMWHMGGHIFAQLGRHSDAAWQQEASARVDHAHMIRDRVLPDQIHNFAHNNEWLCRSLRHSGRVHDAVALAENMIELPRHPLWNRLDKGGCSASYGRRRLLETLELFEQWDALVALAETMYLEPSEEAGDQADRAYLLGKAHAYRRDEAGFAAQVDLLHGLLAAAKAARVEALERAEAEALAGGESRAKVREAMQDVLKEHESKLAQVRERIEALAALDAALAGEDVEKNLALLEKRRFDVAHLARLHLEAGLLEEALDLARGIAERREGRAYYQANLAHVLAGVGQTERALRVFDELRKTSARFDLDMPVFQRLAPLAEARGLPADWRVEFAFPEDVGERIDLATLGPLRWTPPPAPAWSCPDGFGGEVSLADYRGRPVIVILYLGFGCVHCVEQLQAFDPAIEDFRAAGIELVGIGTDTVAQLAESQEGDDERTGYHFPLLADPELEVFHAYRCFDDFESMPLHGTFLVDGEGRVRWQDISYDPFIDWEFLLAESQRLLGLPIHDGQLALPVSASASSDVPAAAADGGR